MKKLRCDMFFLSSPQLILICRGKGGNHLLHAKEKNIQTKLRYYNKNKANNTIKHTYTPRDNDDKT